MGLTINYSEKGKFKIPVKFKRIVREIEIHENKKLGEICFIFVSRKRILEINKSFLKHDYVTDVITFGNTVKSVIAGDIYICSDVVLKNSEKLGIDLNVEIMRVMIHGILHLAGYNDDTKRRRSGMRKKEDFYLAIIKEKGFGIDGTSI